ncbi:hypothetical protein [Halorubrum sp. C191]|uniref:hypothetical protein n=1 Tax=Halorubrum sp. C191 TaxID=1383842 RepID=UPI001181B894|nr:hypothetical protein [Halorubrum sp. C191]
MGKIKPPDTSFSSPRVNSDAITKERLTILWAITLWYNGIGIQHGTDYYHISASKPPSLQSLLGCSDEEWKEDYAPALEYISEDDGVTEKTILRRKVSWAPTKYLLRLSSELFSDYLEQIVVPNSAFNPNKGHIGDPLESLPHRTATEQALSWLEAAGCRWKLYPGQPGHPRADIHGIAKHPIHHDTKMDAEIEVISDHNNLEMYAKKYAMFTERPGDSTWIFENREAAGKTINKLSKGPMQSYLEDRNPPCNIDNAHLQNPENYAIETLNRYLEQSRNKPQYTCPGMDYVQTITGIHESRSFDPIRRPVTIWDTNTDEIKILRPSDRISSITLEELNAGTKLRM